MWVGLDELSGPAWKLYSVILHTKLTQQQGVFAVGRWTVPHLPLVFKRFQGYTYVGSVTIAHAAGVRRIADMDSLLLCCD